MAIVTKSRLKQDLKEFFQLAITAAEEVSDEGRRIVPDTITISGTYVDDETINAVARVQKQSPSGETVTRVIEEGFEEVQTRSSSQTGESNQTSGSNQTDKSTQTSTDDGTTTEEATTEDKNDSTGSGSEESSQASSDASSSEESSADSADVSQSQTQGTTSRTDIEYADDE